MTASDGTPLARGEAVLLEELDRVRREGITEAELARAKAQLRARLVFESDSVTSIALSQAETPDLADSSSAGSILGLSMQRFGPEGPLYSFQGPPYGCDVTVLQLCQMTRLLGVARIALSTRGLVLRGVSPSALLGRGNRLLRDGRRAPAEPRRRRR